MRSFFDLFKTQIVEAKEENTQQLESLLSSLSPEKYSSTGMMSTLQSMKSNYLQWRILITNEASTGLFFTQTHNRNCVLRLIKAKKEGGLHIENANVVIEQMTRTHQELAALAQLNHHWVAQIDSKLNAIEKKE